MEENHTYRTFSGTTHFELTPENTSCTGGTIVDISVPAADEYDQSVKYVLTLKELRSCRGFENISQDQAEEIIQALTQLSALCYQAVFK